MPIFPDRLFFIQFSFFFQNKPKLNMDAPVAYRYPLKRYFSLFAIALAVDMLLAVFLWIGKPNKTEIMDSIKDFTIHGSVFDLACISVGRCIFLIPILAKLETLAVQRSQNGAPTSSGSKFWKILSFLIILGSIVYAIFKGVKVILSFDDGKEKDFRNTDYALCIVFAITSLLFSVILLGYFQHLKKLECHYARFAEDTESGSINSGGEKAPKKKVNIGRLVSLLKPVSITIFLHFISLSFTLIHLCDFTTDTFKFEEQ